MTMIVGIFLYVTIVSAAHLHIAASGGVYTTLSEAMSHLSEDDTFSNVTFQYVNDLV